MRAVAGGSAESRLRYRPAGSTLAQALKRREFAQVLIGPLGSAKTTNNVVKMISLWDQAPIDPADGIRRTRWAAVRNTYPDLLTTTIRDFEETIGPMGVGQITYGSPPMFKGSWIGPDGKETRVELFFLAFDLPNDVKKARGLRLAGVWFNELKELSKANVDMVMSRLGRFRPDLYRQNPQCWYGMLGDSNAPDNDHWLAQIVAKKPRNWWIGIQPGAVLRRGGQWAVNPAAENLPNLAPGYYENMLASKKDTWIRQNLANEFVYHADGRAVHPDFSQRMHVSEYDREPTPGLPLEVGVDFGRTPAMVVGQQQPNGQWWILHELCTQNLGAAAFGRLAVNFLNQEFPGFGHDGSGDPAGDKPGEQIDDTCIELVNDAGLNIFPAPTNNFTARTNALDEVLALNIGGEPAILINPRCTQLIKGLSGGYQFRRVQVAGDERFHDKPDKNMLSHICEALHYLLLGAGEGAVIDSRFAAENERVVAERGGWHMPTHAYE